MENVANLFEDAINNLRKLDEINNKRIQSRLDKIRELTNKLESLETIDNQRNKLEKLYKL